MAGGVGELLHLLGFSLNDGEVEQAFLAPFALVDVLKDAEETDAFVTHELRLADGADPHVAARLGPELQLYVVGFSELDGAVDFFGDDLAALTLLVELNTGGEIGDEILRHLVNALRDVVPVQRVADQVYLPGADVGHLLGFVQEEVRFPFGRHVDVGTEEAGGGTVVFPDGEAPAADVYRTTVSVAVADDLIVGDVGVRQVSPYEGLGAGEVIGVDDVLPGGGQVGLGRRVVAEGGPETFVHPLVLGVGKVPVPHAVEGRVAEEVGNPVIVL